MSLSLSQKLLKFGFNLLVCRCSAERVIFGILFYHFDFFFLKYLYTISGFCINSVHDTVFLCWYFPTDQSSNGLCMLNCLYFFNSLLFLIGKQGRGGPW